MIGTVERISSAAFTREAPPLHQNSCRILTSSIWSLPSKDYWVATRVLVMWCFPRFQHLMLSLGLRQEW